MANNIKGLTVKIGGDTTGLQDALKNANQSAKNTAAELKEIDKSLKLDPGNADLAAQKLDALKEQAKAASEKLSILKEAQSQATEQFKRGEISAESYRALQREVTNAEAAVRKNSDALNAAEKEYNQNNTALGKLGSKMAEVGGKAADFGKSVGEGAVNGLKAVGSAAADAVEGLAKMAGAMTAAVGAAAGAAIEKTAETLVNSSKSAAIAADNYATMSAVTGVSTDTLQAYNYVSELVDVSLDTLTGSMKKNLSSMNAAAKGTGAAASAYEKLGVSVTDSEGNLRDSETVYWELIDALGEIPDETERDALAMQILGKSAQELNPLINTGSEALNNMMQSAYDAGAVMSSETINGLLAVSDNMEILNSNVEAATNNLGGIAAGALSAYYEGAGEIVSTFTQMIQSSLSGEGISDELSNQMTEQITATVSNIAAELPNILETINELIGAIVTAVGEAAPQIIQVISEILPKFVATITAFLPEILEVGVQLVTVLVMAIMENLPQFVSAAMQILQTLGNGIIENLPTIIDSVIELILYLADALIEYAPTLITAAVQIITQLALGLLQALPALIERAPEIIGTLVDALLDNIALLIDCGVKLIVALFENMPAILKGIGEAILAIVKGIVSKFNEHKDDLAEVGLNLVKGLWNGIKDATGWILDKIKGFGDSILGGIKDFFGIHSPSSVMKDVVGKNLALGIGEGFTAQMKRVSKDMNAAIPSSFDTAVKAAWSTSISGADNGMRTFEIVTPVSLGGQKLTTIVSQVQYNVAANRARMQGVTAQ